MHRIKIGLVKEDGQIDAIDALIQPAESTKVVYNGSNGYKAVIMNYEDHSFVRNVIDKPSMSYFSNNLDRIKDIMSKTLIWGTFYGMIKDG